MTPEIEDGVYDSHNKYDDLGASPRGAYKTWPIKYEATFINPALDKLSVVDARTLRQRGEIAAATVELYDMLVVNLDRFTKLVLRHLEPLLYYFNDIGLQDGLPNAKMVFPSIFEESALDVPQLTAATPASTWGRILGYWIIWWMRSTHLRYITPANHWHAALRRAQNMEQREDWLRTLLTALKGRLAYAAQAQATHAVLHGQRQRAPGHQRATRKVDPLARLEARYHDACEFVRYVDDVLVGPRDWLHREAVAQLNHLAYRLLVRSGRNPLLP